MSTPSPLEGREPWSVRTEDRLDADAVRSLVVHHESPCVSLFMPTHRGGPQVRQDPIRLKNLHRAAERALIERGHRSSDVRVWLAPTATLQEDDEFGGIKATGWRCFWRQACFVCFGYLFGLKKR